MVNDREHVDLSVVLPCYNEIDYLKKAVDSSDDLLKRTNYTYEIIIAEDASTDGTDQLAEKLSKESDHIVWMHRNKRIGRGSAVADAFRKARGRIVGFLDIDLEAPAHYILPMVSAINQGADIAVGVRQVKIGALGYVFQLHKIILHNGYKWLARKLLRINLQDVGVGFKFFKRERILPILDEVKDQHWFWDTEIVVRALLKGLKIFELPIAYIPITDRESKVNYVQDSFIHFKKLLALRKELKHKAARIRN